MKYTFVPMNQEYASIIVDTWKYEFVLACVKYAIQNCHYRGEYIRLGVAMFNQRAIKTYEKAGFQKFEQTVGEIGGKTFECMYMRKSL